MTIRELHQFAYRRLPKAQCHDLLHAWAVERFGVASLKDCTAAQLRGLAALVNSYQLPVASDQSSQLETGNRKPATRRASRSGKPTRPGVHKMISQRQIDFIHTLCSELGWTADTLRLLCERELGLARTRHPDGSFTGQFDAREIGSTRAGIKIINALLGEKRRRAAAAAPRGGRNPSHRGHRDHRANSSGPSVAEPERMQA